MQACDGTFLSGQCALPVCDLQPGSPPYKLSRRWDARLSQNATAATPPAPVTLISSHQHLCLWSERPRLVRAELRTQGQGRARSGCNSLLPDWKDR